MTTNYQHWQIEQDKENILWAGFSRKDHSTNTINPDVLDELDSILQHINQHTEIKGLVIYSAKDKGFIAGADVHHFSQLKEPEDALSLLRHGQKVFNHLEQLNVPSVCMIKGFCMGGGTELALACTYRIAEESVETKIGLPEILLGIHPGWGGSVRLPNLIGPMHALPLMLQGNAIIAKKAKKIGLVDAVVPVRELKRAATYYIQHKPKPASSGLIQRWLNRKPLKSLLALMIRQQLKKKANPNHYPAPYALLDCWESNDNSGEIAYENEANSVTRLVSHSQTTRELIRLFFLRERLKDFAKQQTFKGKHIHVVGAGVMGGDIAAWCALQGYTVTLQDQKPEAIAPAIKRAYQLFEKKLKQTRLINSAMDRLIPDVAGHGIAKADLIIEAIFENLEVKQTLFQRLEKEAKPDAILATNTSSIPLDEINSVLISPERLVGIHFFNPVSKMQLVEVVAGKKTHRKVIQQANAFVGAIQRLPLPVKSSPGFLVNRLLMPYIVECAKLMEQGVSASAIDKAAINFGMMMGPVSVADLSGLDICLSVAKNLAPHYQFDIPEVLEQKVSEGKLGRKSGEGFYRYKNGKQVKTKESSSNISQEQIMDRLIGKVIKEAQACLNENVVEDADLLDAAMVFATGFAPFRGGPMQYYESLNAQQRQKKFDFELKEVATNS